MRFMWAATPDSERPQFRCKSRWYTHGLMRWWQNVVLGRHPLVLIADIPVGGWVMIALIVIMTIGGIVALDRIFSDPDLRPPSTRQERSSDETPPEV